jgi:excisionase family DNA binding protein
MPINVNERKGPGRAAVVQENKILVGRHEAAEMLSISCRALDYLVAHKELNVRRIGSRVLIPVADLQRFSKTDRPERLVG